ncbi:MAG: response regulator transcription factor [Planctomycetes bacterium]|nr:response regulator transcription factor [Planctomycetota bacterium]
MKILLVDDHTLVRAGLRRILETQPGFTVVREVADGASALAAVEETAPDVVVLDLSIPGPDGLEVLATVKRRRPGTKVLVLTMHADPEYVDRAVREGADGYLLKDSAVSDLVQALKAVKAGEIYYSPAVQRRLGEILRRGASPDRPVDRLTDREREILRLVAEGLTTKGIAARLRISARTVETHRSHLMDKLDLRSVAQLTQFAVREGLLRDRGGGRLPAGPGTSSWRTT